MAKPCFSTSAPAAAPARSARAGIRGLIRPAALTLAMWTFGLAHADILPDGVIGQPSPDRFSVCHQHGCSTIDTAALTLTQWQQVAAEFLPPAATPAEERKNIARAVGLMERLVGPLTGTSGDKGGDWAGFGQPGQMDCIDEATNTTTYLALFARAGFLKWHSVADRATRGWFILGWPHTTAVIQDRQSGERYAVDSWFLDNGQPPFILPLKVWRDGWEPPAGRP